MSLTPAHEWGLKSDIVPRFGARLIQEGNRLHYLADRAGLKGNFTPEQLQDLERSFPAITEQLEKPAAIRCDNGPEYTGNVLISWAARQNIDLRFIQPGKPQQNAYIERYNRTVRYDWPGQYLFTSLDELQDDATRWQWFYNHERPNMALNGYMPMQHIQRMT